MGDGLNYALPRVVAVANDLYLKTKANLEAKGEDTLNVYYVQNDYGCGYNLARTAIENTTRRLKEKYPGLGVEKIRGTGVRLSTKPKAKSTDLKCPKCGIRCPDQRILDVHIADKHGGG